MKAIDDTSMNTIKRLSGPNDKWPDKRVYCFGSFKNMTREWLLRLYAQQQEEGGFQALDGNDGNLYIIVEEDR